MVTPMATRLTVPNRLTSTGMGERRAVGPIGFSNSTAGPPSASSRVWISVISRRRHRLGDPHQPPARFEPGDEVAQARIGHAQAIGAPRRFGERRRQSGRFGHGAGAQRPERGEGGEAEAGRDRERRRADPVDQADRTGRAPPIRRSASAPPGRRCGGRSRPGRTAPAAACRLAIVSMPFPAPCSSANG